jgi:hypothetical protein
VPLASGTEYYADEPPASPPRTAAPSAVNPTNIAVSAAAQAREAAGGASQAAAREPLVAGPEARQERDAVVEAIPAAAQAPEAAEEAELEVLQAQEAAGEPPHPAGRALELAEESGPEASQAQEAVGEAVPAASKAPEAADGAGPEVRQAQEAAGESPHPAGKALEIAEETGPESSQAPEAVGEAVPAASQAPEAAEGTEASQAQGSAGKPLQAAMPPLELAQAAAAESSQAREAVGEAATAAAQPPEARTQAEAACNSAFRELLGALPPLEVHVQTARGSDSASQSMERFSGEFGREQSVTSLDQAPAVHPPDQSASGETLPLPSEHCEASAGKGTQDPPISLCGASIGSASPRAPGPPTYPAFRRSVLAAARGEASGNLSTARHASVVVAAQDPLPVPQGADVAADKGGAGEAIEVDTEEEIRHLEAGVCIATADLESLRERMEVAKTTIDLPSFQIDVSRPRDALPFNSSPIPPPPPCGRQFFAQKRLSDVREVCLLARYGSFQLKKKERSSATLDNPRAWIEFPSYSKACLTCSI